MTDLRSLESNMARHASAKVPSRRHPYAVSNTKGIALALGGGFSRGFAHLGVLEVLEQEHIPISAIVGTSIGGLLGAAYADGISVQELCELGSQVRVRDFLRYQSHAQDGPKRDRISRFVYEYLQARNVEELLIPTAIVTTDLDTGAAHVFTRGPLDVAIRASCAFPGLFKPVEYEGRRLADGCIVSPVPTMVAMQMNAACVLGIAVGSHEKSAPPERRHLLQPSWAREADVLLEPKVHHIDWNDFSRVDEVREAGAEAMRCALPQLRNLLDRQAQIHRATNATAGMESGLAS
jgi:NTE family protein